MPSSAWESHCWCYLSGRASCDYMRIKHLYVIFSSWITLHLLLRTWFTNRCRIAFQCLPLPIVHISLPLDSVNIVLPKACHMAEPRCEQQITLCTWACALASLSPHWEDLLKVAVALSAWAPEWTHETGQSRHLTEQPRAATLPPSLSQSAEWGIINDDCFTTLNFWNVCYAPKAHSYNL